MKPLHRRLLATALVFTAAVVFTHHALAQQGVARPKAIEEVPIRTEIIIPGSQVEQGVQGFVRGKVRDLADYLGLIYNFLISIVGVLAASMMMIGGFQYLTAGGDKTKVDAGKKRITNALMGMILALTSYVLLNTINPNLVNLEVPTVAKVSTELSFLPFCDKLAKSLNVPEDQIKIVGNNPSTVHVHGACGDPGFYETKAKDNKGVEKVSRLWCVWRGQHRTTDRIDNTYSDYGCYDVEPGNFKALQVCLQRNGINAVDLDKEYDKSGFIAGDLARCQPCVSFRDGAMKSMGFQPGDSACQAWQNTANNGDPMDATFDVTRKGIIQDSRIVGNDSRADRVYYCGYMDENHTCAYVPILCHNVTSCGGYEKMAPHYCTPYDSHAVSECHSYNTLGSKDVRKAGDVAHLYPICMANPCHLSAKCEVPGLAGVEGALGGGGSIRVTARILTAGIAGQVNCESK